MSPAPIDLDRWAPESAMSIRHSRDSRVGADDLWGAAEGVRLKDARVLGRIVSWRMAGVDRGLRFADLFRRPPFAVLEEDERALAVGLCGRIWVVRGGLAELDGREAFERWDEPGTVRVVFANWVEPIPGGGGSRLVSETRVTPVDRHGRSGLRLVWPLVRGSQQLIGSEALKAAVRKAERAAG